MSIDLTHYHKIIGQNIKWIRIHSGFTQQDIGTFLNITFQQVQKYELGTNRVSAGTLLALSQKMNVPVEWFFREDFFHKKEENHNDEEHIDKLEKQSIKLILAYRKIASEEMRRLVLMVALACSRIM